MISIRPAEPKDETAWRELWAAYCEFYDAKVSETVTAENWRRFFDPLTQVNAIVAVSSDDIPIGFAIYILHAHTWTDRTICYLEDLFVTPNLRGNGIGHALISHLTDIGKLQNWERVYWHTNADNAKARRLYDRFASVGDVVRYLVRL